MLEAIQNTAGLFGLLAIGCIILDYRSFEEINYIYGCIVVVTLIASFAVIFVTSLIGIWT